MGFMALKEFIFPQTFGIIVLPRGEVHLCPLTFSSNCRFLKSIFFEAYFFYIVLLTQKISGINRN